MIHQPLINFNEWMVCTNYNLHSQLVFQLPLLLILFYATASQRFTILPLDGPVNPLQFLRFLYGISLSVCERRGNCTLFILFSCTLTVRWKSAGDFRRALLRFWMHQRSRGVRRGCAPRRWCPLFCRGGSKRREVFWWMWFGCRSGCEFV